MNIARVTFTLIKTEPVVYRVEGTNYTVPINTNYAPDYVELNIPREYLNQSDLIRILETYLNTVN